MITKIINFLKSLFVNKSKNKIVRISRFDGTIHINNKGIDIIKKFEGCSLKAYLCPANVLTVGTGHTGSDVYIDQVITEEKANELLKQDLEKFERQLDDIMIKHTLSLNVNQYSALICLIFNIGIGNFSNSTLLKKLTSKDYQGAADQFLVWNKANGKTLEGLVKRRKEERELFLS